MIESVIHLFGAKKQAKPAAVRIAPNSLPRPEAQPHGHQFAFSKVFRWPVPPGQTPQPTTVEVVGSFSGWRKIPLSYDGPSKTWQLFLRDIEGNRTHRYVMLVDGIPSYDKTCDRLARPQGPDEEHWQIKTAKGPRVMLLFGQTK